MLPVIAAIADKVIGGAEKAANSAFQWYTYNKNIDLANTAHQREVKDLIAAGINPIMTGGGTGAQSPTGFPILFNDYNTSGFTDIVSARENYRQKVQGNNLLEGDFNKKITEKEVADALRAKTDKETLLLDKELEVKEEQLRNAVDLLKEQGGQAHSAAVLNAAQSKLTGITGQGVDARNKKDIATSKLYDNPAGTGIAAGEKLLDIIWNLIRAVK